MLIIIILLIIIIVIICKKNNNKETETNKINISDLPEEKNKKEENEIISEQVQKSEFESTEYITKEIIENNTNIEKEDKDPFNQSITERINNGEIKKCDHCHKYYTGESCNCIK